MTTQEKLDSIERTAQKEIPLSSEKEIVYGYMYRARDEEGKKILSEIIKGLASMYTETSSPGHPWEGSFNVNVKDGEHFFIRKESDNNIGIYYVKEGKEYKIAATSRYDNMPSYVEQFGAFDGDSVDIYDANNRSGGSVAARGANPEKVMEEFHRIIKPAIQHLFKTTSHIEYRKSMDRKRDEREKREGKK